MKLKGLKFVGLVEVPQKTNEELCCHTEIHSLGDNQWSIEVYDCDGCFVKEFVGFNGTSDEGKTDLWAELNEWCKEVYQPACTYDEFEAPDGTRGSKNFFYKEASEGRLHSLLAQF